MVILAAHVLVAFKPARDVVLCAFWNGGRWVEIQVWEGGEYGPIVEHWDTWKPGTETPAIPCTPDAVRALVLFRLADPSAVRELVARARAALERNEHASLPMQKTPEFSNN